MIEPKSYLQPKPEPSAEVRAQAEAFYQRMERQARECGAKGERMRKDGEG